MARLWRARSPAGHHRRSKPCSPPPPDRARRTASHARRLPRAAATSGCLRHDRLSGPWKPQDRACTALLGIADARGSSMCLSEGAHNREPEPRAIAPSPAAPETAEELRSCCRIDPRTVIGYGNGDPTVLRPRADVDIDA